MTPFDTFRLYISLKSHFTNPKYDFFKYGGKSKVKEETFKKRRDVYWFQKTSRKYKDEEIQDFFVSNFIATDTPNKLWIGELINSGEANYKDWMRRQQSLTYLFKQESEELFSKYSMKELFDCSKSHPVFLKKHLSGQVSLETMVIYDKIFDYTKNFDRRLIDPVWELMSLKIKKYSPFLNTNIFELKKLLRVIVNE